MASDAACWALATTNSVSEKPRKAAARAMSFFCSGVTRASRRSSFRDRRAMAVACRMGYLQLPGTVYGESPDKSSRMYGRLTYILPCGHGRILLILDAIEKSARSL